MVTRTAQTVTAHYDDAEGWSLRNGRGNAFFGPTFSRALIDAYARENGLVVTDAEREERPQAVSPGPFK